MLPTWWPSYLPGAWFEWTERNGANEVPACFHHSPEVSPQACSVRPCLQPTSAVQWGLQFDSALGRTCRGPAGGDAELWQEVYLQDLAG